MGGEYPHDDYLGDWVYSLDFEPEDRLSLGDFLPEGSGRGAGPVHRRGRFKQNQRKQRRGLMK